MKNKLLTLLTILIFAPLAGSCSSKELSYDEAVKRLDKMVPRIKYSEDYTARVDNVSGAMSVSFADTLPDIDQYPIVVAASDSSAAQAEIFCSTEKSGQGVDSFLFEVATQFNESGASTSGGKKAQINLRKIASGTAYQYIASGKYKPAAFSPSTHLWIEMVRASGVPVTPVDERLCRNIAGIVMQQKVHDSLVAKYGTIDIKSVCNAVVQGDLFMGYTNPLASSTGLNFLQSVLMTFAGGDETKMLSDEVKSSFLAFQQGVPFVSLTTIQMRESVEKGGSLDAFVMEYQTFANTKSLQNGYVFIPFGPYHDNPLYAVGEVDAETQEVLTLFSRFVQQSSSQKLATKFGFNPEILYTPVYGIPSGETLIRAQQLWKSEKNTGNPIVAVFVSDTSGSMRGAPLKSLKKALITGCEFIDEKNYIGLVTFDTTVTKLLPVEQFSKLHKAKFIASVERMEPNGSTAMFDGVLVAATMVLEAKQNLPKCRPIIFVLTDGETNTGYKFSNSRSVIKGLEIPIYTIGYGYDNEILKSLSSLNEAANLNAQTEDIVYQIGELLNAEM